MGETTQKKQSEQESGDLGGRELSERERDAIEELRRRVIEEGEELGEALGVSEEFIESMEYYAHMLYENDKIEEAGTLVEGILALDEERHYPYLLVGDIALEEGRYEDAATCLSAAAEFGPEDPMIEGKLGEALLHIDEIEAALGHLQKATVVAEEEDNTYKRRAEVLIGLVGEAADAVGVGDGR